MAIKGSESKQIFIKKVLELFENSFLTNDNKEIRIPFIENGEIIQIKISPVCAKVNIEPKNAAGATSSSVSLTAIPQGNFEITSEEKQATLDIIERLNL